MSKLSQILKCDKYFFALCWIIMFFAWIPCFLAYYPVLFNYDVINQYTQIISGEYNQHHPIVHTLLCEIFYKLGIGIDNINFSFAMYSLFQMFCLSGVLSYGMLLLRSKGVKIGWQIVVFLWCTLFLMNPIMALSITKDTLFSVFAVLTFLFLLQLEDVSFSRRKMIMLLISIILMILFRNNAKYSIVILIIVSAVLALKDGKYKKLFFTTIASLFVACLINSTIVRLLDAEIGNPREMLCVPMQQVACVYVEDKDSLLEELNGDEIDLLYRCCSKEFLEQYHPEYADYVKLGVNSDTIRNNKIDVIKLYAKIGIKYPWKYIKALASLTQGYWNPLDKSHAHIYDGWADRQGYLLTDMKYMEEIPVEHNSLLPGVERLYEFFATENVQYKVPILYCIFVPAFYVWLFVISAIKMKKTVPNILAVTVTIAYLLTVLLGPGCVPRYSYSIIISAVFFAPIAFMRKDGN